MSMEIASSSEEKRNYAHKNKVYALIFAILFLVTPGAHAYAGVCENQENTSKTAECWKKITDSESNKIQESYHRVILLAKKVAEDEITPDFSNDIVEVQEWWEKWKDAQCSLDSNMVMGSAGGAAGAICMHNINLDRIKYLDGLIDKLKSMSEN